ncbi:hypothetical protein diail_2891 [Diaporthe ilicicola]|nr:hypothetical protein diail_2891 [Diaporthe ilicicola]
MHFSTPAAILFTLSSTASAWILDLYDKTDCAQSGGNYYSIEGSGESDCMVLPGTFGPGVECNFMKDGGFDGPYNCGAEGFSMPPSGERYRDAYCTIWQDGSCGQDSDIITGEGTGPDGCGSVNPGSIWGSIKCRDA